MYSFKVLLIAALTGLSAIVFAQERISNPPKPLPKGTKLRLFLLRPGPNPPSPVSSLWEEVEVITDTINIVEDVWHITSWIDSDISGQLSPLDIVDFRRHNRLTGRDWGPVNWAVVLQLNKGSSADVGALGLGNSTANGVVEMHLEVIEPLRPPPLDGVGPPVRFCVCFCDPTTTECVCECCLELDGRMTCHKGPMPLAKPVSPSIPSIPWGRIKSLYK
jgi:hypothetical protein